MVLKISTLEQLALLFWFFNELSALWLAYEKIYKKELGFIIPVKNMLPVTYQYARRT